MRFVHYRFVFAAVALLLACAPRACFAEDEKPVAAAPQGEVEIKELKATLAVDVLAQHSKVFKTKQKIVRVAVSDPSVADVVMMSRNQFVVIGKNPGAISVTVWCQPD